jgi:L-alanine-DL-glutamate epimerase-like enolase superfamily enzyme
MKIAVQLFNVPMRNPYRSAQRVTTIAQNVLVTVTMANGIEGYGESAPATYVTGETQQSVYEEIQRIAPALEKLTPEEALNFLENKNLGAGTICALETAMSDVVAREAGVPLYQYLRHATSTEMLVLAHATDLSLPILPPDEAAIRAAQAANDGFRYLKIKVGSAEGAEVDRARVRAIAEAAPNAILRLDGNQGFDADGAARFIASITDLLPRIELFEQPTPAEDEVQLALIQSRIPIPVYADESVHNAEDARRFIESGVCRGVVLKLAKSGLYETRRIAEAAHRAGGGCLFGCMMETRIGISAALHLVIALGSSIVYRLDLDGHLLVNDASLIDGGLTQNRDTLYVAEGVVGLGLHLTAPKSEETASEPVL